MEDFLYPVEVEGEWGCQNQKVKTKLQIYFQSKKKSNGGDCVVGFNEVTGKFIVSFKTEEVRRKVLEKGDHETTIENKEVKLRVNALASSTQAEPPQTEGETSKSSGSGSQADGDLPKGAEGSPQRPVVVLENVQENFSEEMLVLMVENISDLTEDDFSLEMISERRTAVVSFKNASDATQFLSKCVKNNRFQQSGFKARLLERTRSVRVENLPPQVMKDMLELYFERKKEGGGEIEAIKMIPEEEAAIVTFLDPEVTETIRGRKHHIYEVPINVYPFYESIGTALYGKDRPRWKLPDPFTESIHPAVWKFLQKKSEIRTINKEMSKYFCEVQLDSSDVKLTPLPTLLKQKCLSVKHIDSWKKNATDAFQNIMTKYKTVECVVNNPVWTVAEKEISSVAKQDIILLHDQTKGVLTVAGLVQDVDRLKRVVEGIVHKVTNQIERADQSVSEELQVPPGMFYILQQDGLQQEARRYPEMTYAYKSDVKKLILSGLPLEVLHLKSWIFEHQLKMKQKQVEIESDILGFLSAVNSEEMSSHLFTSCRIAAVYGVEGSNVVLTGNSDKALADAQRRLRDVLTFQHIAVKDRVVLSRPEWQILHKKLKDTYSSSKKNTVTIKLTAQDRITVSGFCEDVKEVCESLSDFINTYTRVQEVIQVQSAAVIKFIQEKKIHTWKNFLTSKDAEVFFESKRPRIQLNGTQYSVQEVKSFFQKIVNSLHVDFLKIVKPGAKKYFLEKQDVFNTMILKDTNCMVMLQEDVISEEMVEEVGSLSTYCKVQMPNGLIITVAKADLCKYQADVVVNASNEGLQHIGGLALALLRAAGPQLQDVCNRYRSKNGDLKPGDAIVTEAGNLPCQYVIHAVGPRFSDWDKSTAVRLLRRVVRQALNLVMEKGCRSVAIPAISSGIFGFPLDLCAETIAAVVHEHCVDHVPGNSSLSEIHLVNHDEKTTQAMTEAVKAVFGQQVQLMLRPSKPVFLEDASRTRPALGTNDQSLRKATRGEVLERMHTGEGLRIRLRTGNIEDAATTVIVNTISDDLNLNKGAVSQAILSAAGHKIQSAVYDKTRKSTIEYGSIVVTDGYGLKCEQVFHTVCPFWNNASGKSEQILINIIQRCLTAAEKHKMESISIPALGTGNLGFPKDLVAKLLLSEVQAYSRKHAPKHLSEVDIILHPGDSETIACFRRQFGDHKQTHKGQYGQHDELPQATSPSGPLQQSSSGFFSQISTPSLGVYMMRVGTLMLEVSSGDITKQNTDAIVNSSNDSFTLKTGVSRAILMAAGFAVEDECKRLGSQPHKGYLLTQPGQLSCKNIIHIVGQTDPNKIKEMVYKVLQVCEENRFVSVSLPAIGTGAGGVSPSLVADAMINAVVDFEKKKKGTSLKCVKIVVFQAGMMADFHRSLKTKEGTDQPEEKSIFSRIKDTFTSVFGGTSVRPDVEEDFTIVGEEFVPAIFHFCGESHEEVSKAKNYVQDLIMKEQMEHTIKDSCISLFTQEDCGKLLDLQKKLTVSIHLEKRGADSIIQLEGLSRDVLTANDSIKEMMRKVESLDRRKREAALVGAMVEWQHDASGTFVPFDPFTNLALEQAFDSHSAKVKININNLEYMADLTSKEAVSGRQIVKLKRKERKATEGLPGDWDDMTGSELLEVVLGTSSTEYQRVEAEFRKTGLNNQIIKIVRIQNNTLWKNYQIKKDGMDIKNKHSNNERLLFHGTCATTISLINSQGFNRSYAGKNAAMIGNGTYFAVDPKYSTSNTYSKPDAQGHKNMYLARVLVGDFTGGAAGLVVPPVKATGSGSDLYDSVVDNVSSPQMFVIFHDVQAYPEYLITFC
ncbi:protein mono-ADP-ribosyltransferase PARP14-like [Brienomyrus brachyistius]|uniref:protein mono-ADP-ribosyltransferase PARP14-like n=1 Tax=Brienomyrus brachyistius TaxID=42636 RepID=UPI0020B38768|nr:protein mono-ADP-ribosyltransferase PARP14-like [Brienomyrus brachyistius]